MAYYTKEEIEKARQIDLLSYLTILKNQNKKYLNENVLDVEKAIEGAKYIIAEIISDNAEYRKQAYPHLPWQPRTNRHPQQPRLPCHVVRQRTDSR